MKIIILELSESIYAIVSIKDEPKKCLICDFVAWLIRFENKKLFLEVPT